MRTGLVYSTLYRGGFTEVVPFPSGGQSCQRCRRDDAYRGVSGKQGDVVEEAIGDRQWARGRILRMVTKEVCLKRKSQTADCNDER